MSENAHGTSYTEITARQQEAWTSGDCHQIARQNVFMLRSDIEAVFDRYDRATDGSAMIENTYQLTVAERG